MHISVKKKILTYDNYKVKCAIGKRGIGIKKREGDLITPKGIFKIKEIFYRKDRIKNLSTKISIFFFFNLCFYCTFFEIKSCLILLNPTL